MATLYRDSNVLIFISTGMFVSSVSLSYQEMMLHNPGLLYLPKKNMHSSSLKSYQKHIIDTLFINDCPEVCVFSSLITPKMIAFQSSPHFHLCHHLSPFLK